MTKLNTWGNDLSIFLNKETELFNKEIIKMYFEAYNVKVQNSNRTKDGRISTEVCFKFLIN